MDDPRDPREPDDDASAAGLIIPLLGGCVLFVFGLGALAVVNGPPEIPMPSLPAPGGEGGVPKMRSKIPKLGGVAARPRFGGLLFAPSFSDLKTPSDWVNKQYELQAEMASDPNAGWKLGLLYKHRRNPNKDMLAARQVFEDAGRMGSGAAYHELAKMYERGDGVHEDKRLALTYYRKSVDLGLSNGKKKIEALEAELGM